MFFLYVTGLFTAYTIYLRSDLRNFNPTCPLSLRDAYMDVGGRATQEAKAERVGESKARGRGSNSESP